MLSEDQLAKLKNADSYEKEKQIIFQIRKELNPHPAGQVDNIPRIGDRKFGGIQHKYEETVLFFPAQGQTCHAYCTYCFRWAQFVNLDEHKFKSKNHQDLYDYLIFNKQITDVLLTGGDPMYMPNDTLFSYFDVLVRPELNHIKTIRIGSKALAYWPERFLDEQGDKLFEKFERIFERDKNIAFMAHFSHPNELKTEKIQKAVNRLRKSGVQVRTQAPLIKGINDHWKIWRDMWQKQVELGMIPYYMFVERDTGAHDYFSVPLYKAYNIFTDAYSNISGLAKTVRGPSMSAYPGKVLVDGIMQLGDEKYFVLKYLQARDPEKINKPFLARFDESATWLDELELINDITDFEKNIPIYEHFIMS